MSVIRKREEGRRKNEDFPNSPPLPLSPIPCLAHSLFGLFGPSPVWPIPHSLFGPFPIRKLSPSGSLCLLPLSGILVLCFAIFQIEAGVIMQVNDLGFVATILFVLVPSVFLIILYIQTASRQGKKD